MRDIQHDPGDSPASNDGNRLIEMYGGICAVPCQVGDQGTCLPFPHCLSTPQGYQDYFQNTTFGKAARSAEMFKQSVRRSGYAMQD